MEFVVKIECDNSAFDYGNRPHEVARILINLANQVKEGYNLIYLNDENGNQVGTATYNYD